MLEEYELGVGEKVALVVCLVCLAVSVISIFASGILGYWLLAQFGMFMFLCFFLSLVVFIAIGKLKMDRGWKRFWSVWVSGCVTGIAIGIGIVAIVMWGSW